MKAGIKSNSICLTLPGEHTVSIRLEMKECNARKVETFQFDASAGVHFASAVGLETIYASG
jgi:hypothetical protein